VVLHSSLNSSVLAYFTATRGLIGTTIIDARYMMVEIVHNPSARFGAEIFGWFVDAKQPSNSTLFFASVDAIGALTRVGRLAGWFWWASGAASMSSTWDCTAPECDTVISTVYDASGLLYVFRFNVTAGLPDKPALATSSQRVLFSQE
jgi:hypothetical protein